MTLPLAGVRVLDLSNVLAGPFCGYNLCRLGAEVIKIENPTGGDLARKLGADQKMIERLMGLSFIAVNAGKQSIALDLKNSESREIFLQLVEQSDIVLENFRPKVMERLNLDYEVLAARNPRIIYCAISGFGQDGPWAQRPAYDQIVQGLSGAMSVTGDAESAPLRTGFPVSDTIAGLTASFAISSALVAQRATGLGRFIDVSLLESTLAAMGWVVSNHLNAGIDPEPMGNENFTAAPSGTFRTATGPLNIAANEQKQFEKLCDIIGRPELKIDVRFSDRQSRKKYRAELKNEIEEQLLQRPAEEWDRVLNAGDVPSGLVLSLRQVLDEPQIKQRQFIEELEVRSPDEKPLLVTRPGFMIEKGFSKPTLPPILGENTDKWLLSLGCSQEKIQKLRQIGAIR